MQKYLTILTYVFIIIMSGLILHAGEKDTKSDNEKLLAVMSPDEFSFIFNNKEVINDTEAHANIRALVYYLLTSNNISAKHISFEAYIKDTTNFFQAVASSRDYRIYVNCQVIDKEQKVFQGINERILDNRVPHDYENEKLFEAILTNSWTNRTILSCTEAIVENYKEATKVTGVGSSCGMLPK
jgi:hypothetical protein